MGTTFPQPSSPLPEGEPAIEGIPCVAGLPIVVPRASYGVVFDPPACASGSPGIEEDEEG